MKNYQEYDFQRMSTYNKDNQTLSNTTLNNTNTYTRDIRINALEQRIDALEKKLLYYEELISIKDNELEKYQEHSHLINDTFKRIAEIEESFNQVSLKPNYSLQSIDIEHIIEGKLDLYQIFVDSKLNDLTIMMQDLSQYNVNQQKQYSTTQDILSHFSDRINANALKIKNLKTQFKLIQNAFNVNTSEEELFFKNIQRK